MHSVLLYSNDKCKFPRHEAEPESDAEHKETDNGAKGDDEDDDKEDIGEGVALMSQIAQAMWDDYIA